VHRLRPAPFNFERTIQISNDGLKVKDKISRKRSAPLIDVIGRMQQATAAHVPSSRLYTVGETVGEASSDMETWARRLNEESVLTLEREIHF